MARKRGGNDDWLLILPLLLLAAKKSPFQPPYAKKPGAAKPWYIQWRDDFLRALGQTPPP